MILVLLITGSALAFAVLAGVAIDAPVSIGDAAATVIGVPFSDFDPREDGLLPSRRLPDRVGPQHV
jgi:hypothetical protein